MSEPASLERSDSSRHAISVLIVTAAILWNLVVLTRAHAADMQWHHTELRILLGIIFAQVTLGAGYFALGRWNLFWRACVLLVAVTASSLLTAALLANRPRLYLSAHLATGLLTALPLYGMRCFGLRLTHSELPTSKRKIQFSLLDGLSLMTAVAVVAGVSRWAESPPGMLREALDWGLVGTVTGLISLMFPLLFPQWWHGAASALAVSALVIGTLVLLHDLNITWFLVAAAQWLLVTTCCVILRLAGYRLQ
jgi:hypothetical protein